MIKKGITTLVCICSLLFAGIAQNKGQGQHDKNQIGAMTAGIATDWMNLYREIVAYQFINPPQAARLFAYAGVTMYETILPDMHGYKSLQGQLNGLNKHTIPSLKDSNINFEIALNEAMFIVSMGIIPHISENSENLVKGMKRVNNEKLAPMTSATVFNSSVNWGQTVGRAILEWGMKDNYEATQAKQYIVPSSNINPSFWIPTDSVNKIPVEPYWYLIRPFVMHNTAQFNIPSKIPFSTDSNSLFYKQALEVVNTAANRTQEMDYIRFWWSDPTGTHTPSGHWMSIISDVIKQHQYPLKMAVQLYAYAGIAGADAFISCWDIKYKYNLLRPETYINLYVKGQEKWVTGQRDITPPFPEYVSGHSICSGAIAEVLTAIAGDIVFIDSCNIHMQIPPRNFNSFNAAADEAAISRLYGAIHFRESIENGLLQGRKLGKYILKKLRLK